MNKAKFMNRRFLLIVILAVLFLIFSIVAYYFGGGIVGNVISGFGEVCSADVKECADGSYVYRNLELDCQFDSCPEIPEGFCSGLLEEDCENFETCQAIYLYPGCTKDPCEAYPIFQECLSRG